MSQKLCEVIGEIFRAAYEKGKEAGQPMEKKGCDFCCWAKGAYWTPKNDVEAHEYKFCPNCGKFIGGK